MVMMKDIMGRHLEAHAHMAKRLEIPDSEVLHGRDDALLARDAMRELCVIAVGGEKKDLANEVGRMTRTYQLDPEPDLWILGREVTPMREELRKEIAEWPMERHTVPSLRR